MSYARWEVSTITLLPYQSRPGNSPAKILIKNIDTTVIILWIILIIFLFTKTLYCHLYNTVAV